MLDIAGLFAGGCCDFLAVTLTSLPASSTCQESQGRLRKLWCFRPLLCTLLRLNWVKQTPGIMRRN